MPPDLCPAGPLRPQRHPFRCWVPLHRHPTIKGRADMDPGDAAALDRLCPVPGPRGTPCSDGPADDCYGFGDVDDYIHAVIGSGSYILPRPFPYCRPLAGPCPELGCGHGDLCDECADDDPDPGVEPDRCPACRAVLVRSWVCPTCGPPPLAGLDLGASRR